MDVRELTQAATSAMKSKQFARAIQLLKEALRISRRNLAAELDGDMVATRRAPGPVLMDTAAVLSTTDLEVVEEMSVNNDFLIFDRVFLPADADLPAYQSMACLYNIALCYHLWGFCGSGDRRMILRRASSFYRIGLDTAADLVEDDAGPDVIVVVLYLAFLNNQGHINSHFCEHDEANLHLETIYSTLLSLQRRSRVIDPVILSHMEPVFYGNAEGRLASDASFFCPFRYFSRLHTTAAAA